MKATTLAACFACVLSAASPALASDWQDINDPAQLRALYSNKTIRGKDWMDRPFVGHYRADGKGILLFGGERYPRTWAVKGKDQVCIATQVNTQCYRYQRHAVNAGSYRAINVADDRATMVTVEDGIPQF
jgi:hypothetical protein